MADTACHSLKSGTPNAGNRRLRGAPALLLALLVGSGLAACSTVDLSTPPPVRTPAAGGGMTSLPAGRMVGDWQVGCQREADAAQPVCGAQTRGQPLAADGAAPPDPVPLVIYYRGEEGPFLQIGAARYAGGQRPALRIDDALPMVGVATQSPVPELVARLQNGSLLRARYWLSDTQSADVRVSLEGLTPALQALQQLVPQAVAAMATPVRRTASK